MSAPPLLRLSSTLRRRARESLEEYCYRRRVSLLPYFPPEIFLEVTSFCNIACTICPHGTGLTRPKGHMDRVISSRVIAEAAGSGARMSLFLAGEPLLRKDLPDLIAEAVEAGLETRVHTNATILTEKTGRAIIESGLDEISFSFDSSRREEYERTRAGAKFDEVLANIRGFLALKRSLGAAGPRTVIQFLKTDDGGKEERNLRKLFEGLGADRFNAIETHSWAGTFKGGDLYSRYREGPMIPCRFLWNRLVVCRDGRAFVCCNDLQGRHIVGDVGRDGVMAVWNGEEMVRLREEMTTGDYGHIDICRDCEIPFMDRAVPEPPRSPLGRMRRRAGDGAKGLLVRLARRPGGRNGRESEGTDTP